MKARLNNLTSQIIDAAMQVHRHLGPGLLESAYEACLAHELSQRGLNFERQKALPVIYKGVQVDCAYRIDMLVEDAVILELKAVEKIEKVHSAQLLSYLRLTGRHVGLLINFNAFACGGHKESRQSFPPLTISAFPASLR